MASSRSPGLRLSAALCLTIATAACLGPKAPPPSAGAVCAATAGQARPLVVEWPARDRADLEARASQGPIIVRRHGCEIDVLRGCKATGGYRYAPVAPKHDRVVIRDVDELYANLPAGAAKLQAKLGERGELDIAMTIVGEWDLDRSNVLAGELSGDCAGATHAIVALTAGAFELVTAASRSAGGGVEIAGIGVGAGETHSRELLSRDGDATACATGSAHDTRPPERCSALLGIEIVPIGFARQPEPSCPPGWAWSGAQCINPSPTPSASEPPAGARSAALPAGTPAAGGLDGAPMVRVPGGNFRLGSDERSGWTSPQHLITIASFDIDTTEVTLARYRRCVSAGACLPPANDAVSLCNWGKDGRDDHPMNCVAWDEAAAYCKWAGARLPSEEEWEYAALGQSGWKYPWGNTEPAARICWSGPGTDRTARDEPGTCAVDRYPQDRSGFGVRDLAGDVAEWTSSARSSYPKKENRPDESSRIIRGAHFGVSQSDQVRPYVRAAGATTGQRESWLGFRCARTP